MQLDLPEADGRIRRYTLDGHAGRGRRQPGSIASPMPRRMSWPIRSRMTNPWGTPAVDWDTTLAFRHHLWSLGFRIAEAMDTSQRGMGFDWANAKELIRRSIAEARTVEGADLACGAGTDQLAPAAAATLDDVIAAYEEQFDFIEGLGGRAIMMASRALAAAARSAGRL